MRHTKLLFTSATYVAPLRVQKHEMETKGYVHTLHTDTMYIDYTHDIVFGIPSLHDFLGNHGNEEIPRLTQ